MPRSFYLAQKPCPPERRGGVQQFGAEVEARLGGHVVPVVLRRDAPPVDRVFHERVEPVPRRLRSEVDAYRAVVVPTKEQFLAPVAENVRRKTRRALRSVIRAGLAAAVPLHAHLTVLDRVAVEDVAPEYALRVRSPIHQTPKRSVA